MKVLLFTNRTNDLTSQAMEEICAWLADKGVDYDLFSSGIFEEQGSSLDELRASITSYDLVCSFGGDGTTLRAAHIVGKTGIPLLSYNFGRLGFLSGAGVDDLIPAMEAALGGRLSFDARTMLEATVFYEDGRTDRQIAVNEITVSRGHFGRIVSLDLSINDTFIATVSGDGILVATPTGSTGYALSAGGPIISPAHGGLCVVPISPHTLTTRAIVTTERDVINIVPNKQNRQQLVLFIDGEVLWIASANKDLGEKTDQDPLAPHGSAQDDIIRVEARVCPEKLLFARFGDYDFYDHISRTFFRGGHA